ncbi:hypothetical protein EVAR_5969_1 [Eumeta japonica]|uniref:Uncharacterized protein n=1 Tax=Eumeta variegata TaxID=151549 RepID=A0A4C1TD68_EUMVA|nr:hypothetical protein EVAR_5969_1 [Eumeta japonica]
MPPLAPGGGACGEAPELHLLFFYYIIMTAAVAARRAPTAARRPRPAPARSADSIEITSQFISISVEAASAGKSFDSSIWEKHNLTH